MQTPLWLVTLSCAQPYQTNVCEGGKITWQVQRSSAQEASQQLTGYCPVQINSARQLVYGPLNIGLEQFVEHQNAIPKLKIFLFSLPTFLAIYLIFKKKLDVDRYY